MRTVSDRNILDDFCDAFCKIVEAYTEYIIVSGFVAIASGRTRGTEDIDMIVKPLEQKRFLQLHNALVNAGFLCIQSDYPKDVFAYLAAKTPVRYTRRDMPLPEMELKFAKDPLDDYQLRTRTKLPFTGLSLWFSNINVNVAFKII